MPSSSFTIFVALLWAHPIFISLSYCGDQNCTQYLRWGLTNAQYSRTLTSDHLAMLCLTCPKVGLALLVTRAHWQLILSLPSTKTPRSLSAGLHSSILSHSLYVHPGLHHPRCRICHLTLVYTIEGIDMLTYNLKHMCKPFVVVCTKELFICFIKTFF